MATTLPNVGKLKKNSSADDDGFGPDPTRLVPRLRQIHKLGYAGGEEDLDATYQSPGRVWPRNSGVSGHLKALRSNDVTNQRATPEMHGDTPISDEGDGESSSSVAHRLKALRKTAQEFALQGHTEVQGIPIAIENRKGSVRKGTDADGNEWKTKMKFPYGYIKGSKGADGEEVDVYVGPSKDAPVAYVVHQRDKDTGKYDEDKVMLGFNSKKDAKEAFLDHYDDPGFLGPIAEVPVERLKELTESKKKLVKISHPLLASFLQEVRTLL